jgi:outer membrane protein assembly factor BamC
MLNLKNIPSTSLQRGTILLLVAFNLSGCSTLQSWFPDKEKDYQFTTELPPLVIPPDLIQKPSLSTRSAPVELSQSKITKVVEPVTRVKEVVKTVAPVTTSAIETTPALIVNRPTLADAETELSRNEIQISLTHENTPTLNLNVPSIRAWRIVGKALSRSNIEVTNRNQDSGQIQIQVADLKPKTEVEKSLLDNAFSIFDGFVNNETSYVLKFHEANEKTALTVLNTELQPLTDGTDNKLLTILFDAIKTDLSK